MIGERVLRAIGAIDFAIREVFLGWDVAACPSCGHTEDVSEVPLEVCPRCGDDLDELEHYRRGE